MPVNLGELQCEPLLQTKPEVDDTGATTSWHERGSINHEHERSQRCSSSKPERAFEAS
jgi:hypothetical protein